jgi:hypothetical protein
MHITLNYGPEVKIVSSEEMAQKIINSFVKGCEEDYITTREDNIIKVIDTTLDDMIVLVVNIKK